MLSLSDWGLSVHEQPMHFQCIVVEFRLAIERPCRSSGGAAAGAGREAPCVGV